MHTAWGKVADAVDLALRGPFLGGSDALGNQQAGSARV
jgi:hypothetical protein